MSEKKEEIPKFTSEFRSSVVDFSKDLIITFPEHKHLIEKWSNETTTDEDYQKLFEYCLKVYPERFFDILNQDISIFSEESSVNVSFFPGLNFKMVYNCDGVSDKIRETVWKYLQVILLILVKSMKNKMNFGEAMDIFNKMDVSELQGQLENTMSNISKFFDDFESNESTDKEENKEKETTEESNEGTKSALPKVEDIREHLQFLFNGKIGKLAKELADDMSSDLAESFGAGLENVNSTADVLSAIMKNPEKMGNVVKTVKDKLANKMESGDITKEDLVKEASEMMNKMQGLGDNLGGMGDMGKMFKGMAGGNMGDMGKMFKDMAKSMGMNIPKGARMNTNAMNEAQKKTTVKERLKSRALARKQEEVVKQLEAEAVRIQREREYAKFQSDNPDMEQTIRSLEVEKQEKSPIRDPNVLSASQKKRMKKKARKEKENNQNKDTTSV